ncbi:MAG: TSUP family transporter [Orrella sp.]
MAPLELMLLTTLALGASYIQASAGFSFSIVFVSVASSLGLLPLWQVTELASLLVIVNAVMALASSPHRPDFPLILPMIIAMAPAIAVGVWLLFVMDVSHTPLALMLLGGVTLLASAMLFLNLKTHPTPSNVVGRVLTGLSAGLLGGMLAAPGPPLVLSLYRQPRLAAVMRVSLLAVLMSFGVMRLVAVQLTEPTTLSAFFVFLACAPVSLLGAWFGTKYPPPLSDINLRRASFALLSAVGVLLLLEGYWQLASA